MASLIYDSFMDDIVKNNINLSTDTFKVMLVTSAYTPVKGTHNRRSSVTNEATGTGYTSGGIASATTVSLDTTNNRSDTTFANVQWTSSTITARACVIYKSTGTAANDPLVAYVDFGQDVSSTSATFAITFSSPLRFQN